MAVSLSIIGRHIRSARRACGYTQEKVAEQLKMTVAHYGRLERGERTINLERLSQLSVLLCVPIEKLVEGCVPEAESTVSSEMPQNDFEQKMHSYLRYCSEETLTRMLRVCDALAIEDKEQN